jgi:hypothetical protein
MNPFDAAPAPPPMTQIDKLVFAALARDGIEPSGVCTDAVFVRRAFLDVIGTFPTAAEAREFLLDKKPQKRAALIDRLLAREEFADYWAMKWCDLLRVKAEFPINLWPNAAQAYHRWIRTSVKENTPYDRFARQLLTSTGSNFRSPEVNFFRAVQGKEPQVLAQAVALAFMGCRADKWPNERLAGMAGFFARVGYKSTTEWKEEIIFFDRTKPAAPAVFPDGTPAQIPPDQDPRIAFANWLIAPANPWFAKAIVNRVWSWLLGRGIVHEPDDIRPDNPPVHPELLAYLADELVRGRYDLKHVFRLVLNSGTYQLSSVPKAKDPDGKAAARFARYSVRRLEAEVLIDALNQITGTTEKYTSPIPEPFTFIPEDQRSIALPDGSITSPFLEMFGRPPRDTGLESERNNRPSPNQRLHLLNSSHIQQKIEQGRKMQPLLIPGKPRDSASAIFLTLLSRFPTDEEIKVVEDYCAAGAAKGREAMVDLVWALINSAEFLYRH